MNISKIDKNLDVSNLPEGLDAEFYDTTNNDKFNVYGLIRENNKYCRMPACVSEGIESGIDVLSTHTSGGRVCFTTNSKFVAITAVVSNISKPSHITRVCTCGFDMYVDNKFYKIFAPPEFDESYSSYVEFPDERERNITINFPLYGCAENLYIGLEKDADIKPYSPYANNKKVVYYGSSITQGGCASRPGLCYPALISRKTKTDFVNLGFSGSAKGEDTVAKYIASLQMDVFVYDYDYNTPSLEHLKNTHKRFFQIIREKHPNLPVIMISKPDVDIADIYCVKNQQRRNVIFQTYLDAFNSGDENVFFIDGFSFYYGEDDRNNCTIDGCHPNDLGFRRMATIIGEYVDKILNKNPEQKYL